MKASAGITQLEQETLALLAKLPPDMRDAIIRQLNGMCTMARILEDDKKSA